MGEKKEEKPGFRKGGLIEQGREVPDWIVSLNRDLRIGLPTGLSEKSIRITEGAIRVSDVTWSTYGKHLLRSLNSRLKVLEESPEDDSV